MHVLLVDDDEDEVSILCGALEDAGVEHKCTWARDVNNALSTLNGERPDIIFIDLNMPVITGLEGIAMIRAADHCAELPLVLYSSHISEESAAAAKTHGAICLQKPSTSSALINALRTLFEKHMAHM